MSRETVACVTLQPGALERIEQLLLRAEALALDEARHETLPLGLRQLKLFLHRTSIMHTAVLDNV